LHLERIMTQESPDEGKHAKTSNALDPGPPWSRAFAWIENEVGGRITRFERQPRWRPAFFIELERGSERLRLYLRGARAEIPNGDAALHHEMRVLQQLEAGGIPVPHVHGMCPEPVGIVMDWSPGRANLATADDDAQRHAVLNDYIEILARMHALPVGPFEDQGMSRPVTNEELGYCDLARWRETYLRSKRRPEPLIEFVLGWLDRNVPRGRSRVSILAADAGQFLFEGNHVTALLDLELACLGDPAADLGGMRGRDLSEPLGDLPPAFERYFELTGETIPKDVIDYHTVRFNLNTPLAVAGIVANPPASIDLVQYLGWYWVWSRACLEVIAHGMQLPLEPLPSPEARTTPYAGAHDALAARLEAAGQGGDYAAYEIDAAYRTAEYLRRAERYGPAQQEQAQDDIGALLDKPMRDWAAADQALEDFVKRAGPERDAELVALLHRRTLRHEFLLQPVLRELEGASIQLLD
jgi:hypothetical protein